MKGTLDYSTLNPGIRETVRLLRQWGFNTSDSGDGKTNVEAGMEGALTYPHVHCVVHTPGSPMSVIVEANRLKTRLEYVGLQVTPGMVQATYDPAFPINTVSLMGVDDAALRQLGVPP